MKSKAINPNVQNDNIHKGSGHRERLRERFLNSGLHGFHDYEVIELLLTLATPRKDCKVAAKTALKHFKTFQGVLEAPPEELHQITGIGPKSALGIKLINAVLERYLEKRVFDQTNILNSRQLYEYLVLSMGEKSRELFKGLFLDAKNNVIRIQTLFEGTLTSSAVYPREVIKCCLETRAAAMIFAHNHPSGDPTPSQADILITKKLLAACCVMDITVHEHIIIAKDKYYSFADMGHIAEMMMEYKQIGFFK